MNKPDTDKRKPIQSANNLDRVRQGVAHYNRKTNEVINALRTFARQLETFKTEFDGQQSLQIRVDAAQRILAAACNRMDALRPRLYMVEER